MMLFKVGGCIRDELLGVPSKDVDYTVVLDSDDDFLLKRFGNPFDVMVHNLKSDGYKIFLKSPEYLTVRARFPRGVSNLTADFVLARKESDYADGRRPDTVEPGTLRDDLSRRDFTMNAIAQAEDGTFIDPFDGRGDIQSRVIRAVGNPYERLAEDALRAVRAVRFGVTKQFTIDNALSNAMESPEVVSSIRNKISDERIQQELSKMFRFDTMQSLLALQQYPALTDAMFSGKVSLDATMKLKGRSK